MTPERSSAARSMDPPRAAPEPTFADAGADVAGSLRAKRAADVLLSAAGLALSAPLWPLLALAVKVEDGGPVFFHQKRVGKNGTLFRNWKFRSMRPESDGGHAPRQASDGDPRITRVGRFMRATALDELPQLWVIFKGEMSFVGPRALLPAEEEVARPGGPTSITQVPGYEARHRVRPGLTGLAQLRLPRDAPREEKFRYDVAYLRHRSLWLDLRLIVRSVLVSLTAGWADVGRDAVSGENS